MAHSIFSASASNRWANCPGSIVMTMDRPNRGNSSAREGTSLHELSDTCLQNDTNPIDFEGTVIEVEGEEFEMTDERVLAAQMYVDYVRSIPGLRWSESRISYADVLGIKDEEGFGTVDCAILDGETLHVIDAKFGRRFVNPKHNKQMTLYALGLIDAFEATGETIETVHLHIVQPRVTDKPVPFKMDRTEVETARQAFREAVIQVQASRASFNEFVLDYDWVKQYLIPGESQCQWCPAATVCPALGTAVSETDAQRKVFDDASPEDLAEMYTRIGLLEIWIKAVETEMTSRLNDHKKVPGFKLVLGREGNRKWSNEDEAAAALANTGIEIMKPPVLKTPPQIEKDLKKAKLDVKLIEDLVTRSPAKPTITSSDDPRAEWEEDLGFEPIE